MVSAAWVDIGGENIRPYGWYLEFRVHLCRSLRYEQKQCSSTYRSQADLSGKILFSSISKLKNKLSRFQIYAWSNLVYHWHDRDAWGGWHCVSYRWKRKTVYIIIWLQRTQKLLSTFPRYSPRRSWFTYSNAPIQPTKTHFAWRRNKASLFQII